MNSVIICEGSTDYSLLQYYMRKAYGWVDGRPGSIKFENNRSRDLIKHGNDFLTIMSSGGCGNLLSAYNMVWERNNKCKPDLSDAITKVAIITDRDEIGSEANFIHSLIQELNSHISIPLTPVSNNHWALVSMNTRTGIPLIFEILVMVIPFAETGALETFLLNAVSASDPYDAQIITKGKFFVQNADPLNKYLTKRCYKTKAEFDAYFCIRTAPEQFVKRQDILKGIPWEGYPKIQEDFKLLGDL